MQIYAVVGFDPDDEVELKRRTKEACPANNHYFVSSALFVATDGEMSKEVGERLGLGREPPRIWCIIMPCNYYWGFRSADL